MDRIYVGPGAYGSVAIRKRLNRDMFVVSNVKFRVFRVARGIRSTLHPTFISNVGFARPYYYYALSLGHGEWNSELSVYLLTELSRRERFCVRRTGAYLNKTLRRRHLIMAFVKTFTSKPTTEWVPCASV